MKKIILAFSIISSLYACTTDHQHIKGSINGGHGETLYLYAFRDGEDVILDSTVIDEKDQFELIPTTGLFKDIYRLGLSDNDFLILITDSTEKVTVNGKFGELKKSVVEGSPSTIQVGEFMSSISAPLEELFELMALEDTAVEPKIMELQKNIEITTRTYVDGHANDPASLIAIQYLDPINNMDMFEKVVMGCKNILDKSEYFESFAVYIDKQKNLAQRNSAGGRIEIGQPLSNISLPNPSGQIMSITDLKGKVVLVDCWASWCGPCRRENPNVVKNYNQFHAKGFEVFSISLDADKGQWQNAIQQDKLSWPYHVSDLKQWESVVVSQWKVESIPYSILIDKEGIVRAFGDMLRGENLEKEIKKLIP